MSRCVVGNARVDDAGRSVVREGEGREGAKGGGGEVEGADVKGKRDKARHSWLRCPLRDRAATNNRSQRPPPARLTKHVAGTHATSARTNNCQALGMREGL